jgi:hypothetical protein
VRAQGSSDAPAWDVRPGRGIGSVHKERPQPRLVGCRAQCQPCRVDPVELCPQPIRETALLLLQILPHAQDVTQLHEQRIVGPDLSKGPAIGTQRIGEDMRIPLVVFGPRGRESVAKAIELLRIERKDTEADLDQGINHHASRRLDPPGNRRRGGVGLRAAHGTASCTAAAVCATVRVPRICPWASSKQSSCASLPQSIPNNHSKACDTRSPF